MPKKVKESNCGRLLGFWASRLPGFWASELLGFWAARLQEILLILIYFLLKDNST